jgi:hypothetical protein
LLPSCAAAPRCLNTAGTVLAGLPINATDVEELVRETLGEDTCDARRSASDPPARRNEGGDGGDDDGGDDDDEEDGPCDYERGLRTLFPEFDFKVRVWPAVWSFAYAGLAGFSIHFAHSPRPGCYGLPSAALQRRPAARQHPPHGAVWLGPTRLPLLDRRAARPVPPGPDPPASCLPVTQVHDPSDKEGRGFGLLGDADHLWTKARARGRAARPHQVCVCVRGGGAGRNAGAWATGPRR